MQKIRFSRYFKVLFILIDVITISAFFLYFYFKNNQLSFLEIVWEQAILSIVLLSLFWILLSNRTKIYSIARNMTFTIYLERLVTHIFIFIFGVILLSKVTSNSFLKQDHLIININLSLILLFFKSFIFFGLKYIRTLGLNFRNVMFFSSDSSTEILKNILLDRKDYGFKIYDYPTKNGYDLEKLVEFWKKNGIHTMFISSEPNEEQDKFEVEIYQLAKQYQVKMSLIPSMVVNDFFQYDLSYIETQPILVKSKFPLEYLVNRLIKRIFDIVFSVFILVFIGIWLFPIVSILIKLNSKGPVLFKQKRYGYHDEVFECLKFRTMVADSDSTQTTKQNDQRITKIGRFLRKTSLDEMPQFINVLRGEMSTVGPRPHMLLVDDFYKLKIGRYSVRSLVKPGVSGMAQANGLRGDAGNMEVAMQKRILADAFYVKNWTFSLDLVIIFKTVILVIGGDKNAY